MKDANTPAFPRDNIWALDGTRIQCGAQGITLRQYASIKLRQPDSGLDWLDAMILKAKRDDFAAQALASMGSPYNAYACSATAKWCGEIADAMIAKLNKGAGDE